MKTTVTANPAGLSLTRFDTERPTLVFVHGGCHGSWQWAHWQRWFSVRGWNSVAVDWLHHNQNPARRTERGWLDRSLLDVTDDVAAAVATAGPAPILIGHSMGGFASLNYACSPDAELSGLVLLAPVLPKRFGGEIIDLDVDVDQPWGPPPPEISRKLFYAEVDDSVAAQCFANLQPESPRCVWEATRYTIDVDVSGLAAPAFVVAAEQDLLTPAPLERNLAYGINADFAELPGVGHGITLGPGWPQLAARVESWILHTVLAAREPIAAAAP